MCHHRSKAHRSRSRGTCSTTIVIATFCYLSQFPTHVHSEAQFFDFFSKGKSYFTGSSEENKIKQPLPPLNQQQSHLSANLQQQSQQHQQTSNRRIFGSILGGGGGGGSGYGAPQPGYGSPNPRPAPSYNSPPSYGGGKPKFNLPNPLDIKAGALRSKGRIASGLLHAKAGILRAGANILNQKANTLDRVAQTIPSVNAKVINALQGLGGIGLPNLGGGGGYGAPKPGYGAPTPPAPSYGTPGPRAPAPVPSPNQGYNSPSDGYGVPRAPVVNNNNNNNIPVVNNINNNNIAPQSNNLNNVVSPLTSTFTNNNNNNLLTNNFVPSSQFQNQQQVQLTNNNFHNGNSQLNTNQFFNQNNANLNNNFNTIPISNNNLNNNGNNIITSNNIQSFSQAQQQAPNSYSVGSVSTATNNNNNVNNVIGTTLNNAVSTGNNVAFPTNNNIDAGLTGVGDTSSSAQLNFATSGTGAGGGNPFLTSSVQAFPSEPFQQAESQSANLRTCPSRPVLDSLLEDLFMGNEMIPDVLDEPPLYPLDLVYKTIRTYPGMRLTADMTRFKPMMHWPADPTAYYTVVISNLDINNRRNRTLSEFWHWFVANIPGDAVDEGEVLFDLLFPLVLPEGDGDHRFGYFVFKQPQLMDYADEGGPTDACSPNMSNGRGPFKSTKNFKKKYNLELTAATFLIIDYNEESMDIACEWQRCIGDTINLVSPLRCGASGTRGSGDN